MAQTATNEYQVKAVFLFNFAQFVQWPSEAFAGPESPLVIGVLGDDPFGKYLDDTVRGERINNHPLVVQRYSSLKDVRACQVLFISASESPNLQRVVDGLKSRSILTVGDVENFSRDGGMIRFITENHKLRLAINVEAAKAAHLTISSKLLRPARIVTAGGG